MFKKILLIFTAAVAVIAIAFTVFVKTYVTPERVKAFLVPYAEQALNRKVSVGEVNISLFKGIDVKDFAIKEADEKADFVRCKSVVLKFKLLPLLTKKVVVDELKLMSPEVRIIRDDKGTFNFEGIGRKEEPQALPEKGPSAETKGLPVSLLVNNVSVRDSRFYLTDSTRKLPDVKGSIDLEANIKSSDGTELNSSGDLTLKLDEIDLHKPSKKPLGNIIAALKYAVQLNLEAGNVRIDRADLQIQGIPASITGDLNNYKKEPEVDIAVSIPKLKIEDVRKGLSSFAGMKGLALSGFIAAEVKVTGMPKKLDTMKANGFISLDKTGIAYNSINTTLDGNIKFSDQLINVDLKGTVGKNTAELKGSVSDIFKTPDIRLNLYSKQLFLEELFPARKPAGKGAPAKEVRPPSPPASSKTAKEAEPMNLKLKAEGEVKIGSAKYKGMSMSDFYAKYLLKDNKFEIVKLTASAGRGGLNVQSIVDLSKRGYTYSLSAAVNSVHAEELVNAFFPKAKDTVFGTISSNLKLNGAGTLPENIRRNLVGEGDFNIKDGKITGAKVTDNLSKFLNIPELKTIDLRQANGTVKINSGVARLDSVFTSDDIAMNPAGNIGLDETLDLAFDLKLSPRLSQKAMGSGVSRYIKDEAGWGNIPLKVSGTFSNPSYNVDIGKAGKRAIEKEVGRALDKLFKKDKATDGDKTSPEKKAVEDLLKEIFK
ncbi:MAG: AsmA family protein [Nitrospirae bacterium]|nr:AsmA family protein [Nitrospirota bacterium]